MLIWRRETDIFSHACIPFEAPFREKFDICEQIWGGTFRMGGAGRVVGIATAYGLDGPGIESRWGRDFLHLSRPPLRPTQPPVQWVPGLYRGVRCGRAVTLTPHPLLVPRSKTEWSYTSTLPKGLCGLWKGETCLLSGRALVLKSFQLQLLMQMRHMYHIMHF
jgi:hypothetical protein